MRIAGLMQDYADAIKVADKSNLATLKNSIAQRLDLYATVRVPSV